jgi:acyl-coenzyme A thioesterase PaaI-like protein
MFTALNPDYAADLRRLNAMPYFDWLGLQFERIVPGEVDILMPFRREITFDGKAVQAGPIGALIDFSAMSSAFTLVASGVFLSTIDYSVKCVAPAIGEAFLGRGQVISNGRSLIVARADVFAVANGKQTLVATGLATARVPARATA